MTRRARDLHHARHARLVRILKISLPLIALAIMSSLFLFSRGITIEGALPYAELDIEDRLREPKMTDVQIATTSADGAEINITAQNITPQGENRATARTAFGTITTTGGTTTQLTAPDVAYDAGQSLAALTGGVEIQSLDYVMTTQALDVAIDLAQVDSRSAVRAVGPLGQLDAGLMRLTQNDGGFVLVFKSGVRLLYTP